MSEAQESEHIKQENHHMTTFREQLSGTIHKVAMTVIVGLLAVCAPRAGAAPFTSNFDGLITDLQTRATVLSNSVDKTPKALPSPSGEFLEVPAPPLLGLWTVKAKAADNRTATLGFSVNAPKGESRFKHLEKSELDVIFGKDGYLLAEDAAAHKETEKLTRYGYEVFPWIMFLILMIVTLENVLANTFYKEAPAAKKTAATA